MTIGGTAGLTPSRTHEDRHFDGYKRYHILNDSVVALVEETVSH